MHQRSRAAAAGSMRRLLARLVSPSAEGTGYARRTRRGRHRGVAGARDINAAAPRRPRGPDRTGGTDGAVRDRTARACASWTSRSWAQGSPACTCCTSCATSGSRPRSSSAATASAARGTGTAIRVPAATWRASTTPSPSMPISSRNGSGASDTHPSRRSSGTPITSPTGSTCARTSSSRRASTRPCGTTPNAGGRSRRRKATRSRPSST